MEEKVTKTAKKPSSNAKAVDPVIKQLLEAGAHFGQRVDKWNPKMKPYIYGARGGVHIIDLNETGEQLKQAENYIENVTKKGGKVLFVGTKRQAKPIIEKYATEAAMPYVSTRWLGGMLTNLATIRARINKLKKLQEDLAEGGSSATKKEQSKKEREAMQLDRLFAGISDMEELPAVVFVVDIIRDKIAVTEANKLGIATVAICDTNSNPEMVTYPIAANDDAVKTIDLITSRIAKAASNGYGVYKSKTAETAAKQDAKNNQEEK